MMEVRADVVRSEGAITAIDTVDILLGQTAHLGMGTWGFD
jgi:hypothetical protein